MKTLITLLSVSIISTAFAGPEPVVTPPAPPPIASYFNTGLELGITGNGAWTQTAWRDDRYLGTDHTFGGGLFANYWFTQNFGAGVSFNGFYDTAKGERVPSDTRFVGTVPVMLLARYPIGNWAPFAFVGAGALINGGNSTVKQPSATPGKILEFERYEHDVKLVAPMGAGIEYKFSPKLGIIGSMEFDKVDRPSSNFMTSKVGLSYSF